MHHQCKCSVNGVVFRSFSWYKGQSPLWKGVPSCTRPRRRRRARGVCAHAQQQPKARAFSTPTQCRLALAAVVLHDVGSWLAKAAEGRAWPRTAKDQPVARTSLPVSPKRGASEGPQKAAFQKLALQGRYIQRTTIRTALKAVWRLLLLYMYYKVAIKRTFWRPWLTSSRNRIKTQDETCWLFFQRKRPKKMVESTIGLYRLDCQSCQNLQTHHTKMS